jgi:signal transduction histidine kinase
VPVHEPAPLRTQRLRRLPISVRLGATFALSCVVVLVVLSGLAYWGLGQLLRNGLDRSLVDAVHSLGEGTNAPELDDRLVGGVESTEVDTQVLAGDGRVLGYSDEDLQRDALLSADQLGEVWADGAMFLDVADDDGEPHRALAVPREVDGRGNVLVALAELDPVEDAQAGLLRLALVGAPLAGLLAGAAGWLVARQGLRPIHRMTAQAAAISPREPFPRLAVPPTHDEVAHLGVTLNSLLDRIEEARHREREFTADASHELRTPLAILRAELELARSSAHGGRLDTALDSALEEADRLGHLVDDLLLLARADAGYVSPQALVDVGEAVDGLLPGFRTLAERRGIQLTRSGDGVVWADARALARAVANMLDNAVRHAPDGGHVALVISQQADSTAITVTDDGPGVPPEERPRLTQRFAQLDRAKPGGAGLGLAIVASVAAAHEGWVEFADGPSGRGLSVTLHLPPSPAPSVLA